MHFKYYDNLRVFDVVARHLSFTAAARALNLTKGAVSYQIAHLENELGFKVFERRHRGIALTTRGRELYRAARTCFRELEREIDRLRGTGSERITIGMSTYFASRWLSPRLMRFITDHAGIGLRIQPMINLLDLETESIDLAIRWGKGDWTDMKIELLFSCPAIPTAGAAVARRVRDEGLTAVMRTTTLLHDREGSTAWADWHRAAGLPFLGSSDELVIPDPNVRVQAVIDGQGLALNDALVDKELSTGRLHTVSETELDDYGYYLAYPAGALENAALRRFRDWIMEEARPSTGEHRNADGQSAGVS